MPTCSNRLLGMITIIITMIPIALFNVIFMLTVAFSLSTLNGIPVPPITISELVVKKPSRNPIFAGRSKVPVVAGVCVARLSDTLNGFVLGLLDNVAPVVRWLPLAIMLQVALIGR